MIWRAWSARLIVSSEAGIGRPVLGDRVRDVAQRRAHAMDAPELTRLERLMGDRLGAHAVGALAVDHPPIDEPRQRVVEGRELLERETIVGVIGVQEVEGVFEVDVVSVTRDRAGRGAGCSSR